MKKIVLFLFVATALVFASCNKGNDNVENKSTEIQEKAVGLVAVGLAVEPSRQMNTYSIGELHNKLCANIITQGKDSEFFKPSTKSILNWIDINEKYLKELYPRETENIQKASKIAKDYFLSFPDDRNGVNELFSKEIYDRQFVAKFYKNSDIPRELSSLIQEMHTCLLDSRFNETKYNDCLLKIKRLPDNYYKEAFLDVYQSPAYFWKNEANKLPCYAKPPDGWSDDAWVALCDAIGSTAGFVAGGWTGWIVGTAVATVVSISVAREIRETR